LLLRVFREDVLQCPCGGRTRNPSLFTLWLLAMQAELDAAGIKLRST
jgi:hypothetical protein